MSQSGELVAVSCHDRRRSSREAGIREHKLLVFDREGNLLIEHALPYRPVSGSAHPVISPDDRFIAVPLSANFLLSWPVVVFDTQTGEELFSIDGYIGNDLRFSPDSRLLCISNSSTGAVIIDLSTGEALWSTNERLRNLTCSESASVISGVDSDSSEIRIFINDTETHIAYSKLSPEPTFSPGSEFLLIQQDLMADRHWDTGLLPCVVARIKAGE
jgi:WD40 repeat protein